MLYRKSRSQYHYKNGPFSIVPDLPGYAIPDHRDHGYGPLARFDDTTLEPGGFVPMHEHRNDEIITYVSDGLVRHADSSGARLVASPTWIMVMNSGKGFWHEEGTRPDDPTLHGLQIFVRPHTVDLEPNIQFREIGSPALNEWRLLAGPENTEALSFVRNDVQLYDAYLMRAVEIDLPKHHGWTPSSIPIAAELTSTGQASKRKRVHSWSKRRTSVGTRGCNCGGILDQP
jgi:hypothetical protein